MLGLGAIGFSAVAMSDTTAGGHPPGWIDVPSSRTVNFDGGTNRVGFDGGTDRVDFSGGSNRVNF